MSSTTEGTLIAKSEMRNGTIGALARAGITTFEQMFTMTESQLLRIPGIGSKGLREIRESLLQLGFRMKCHWCERDGGPIDHENS